MPSLTYNSLTELEAVNLMLSTITEAPVSTLAVTGDLNVSMAQQILYDTSREVQTYGFYFNTEECYPLARTADNYINIPDNALSLDVSESFRGYDVTQRGNRLYDRENHTYVFDKTIEVDMVLFLSWDDLPQYAKQYITIKAARKFQRRMLGSESLESYTMSEEMEARSQLMDSDASAGDYNYGNPVDMQRKLRRF